MEFAIVLLVVILIDIAALRWGVDSREKIDSPEWERRRYFRSACRTESYKTERKAYQKTLVLSAYSNAQVE